MRFPKNSGESDNKISPIRRQYFKGNHINSHFACPDMPEIYPNHIVGTGRGHSSSRFNLLIFNGF